MPRRPAMMKELCTRLRSARIKNTDSKHLIPEAALDDIFEDFDVNLCIREIGIALYHHQESAQAIRTGGRKIFSILALLGQETLIVDILGIDGLVKKSEIDNKLPFELPMLRSVLGSDVASQFFEVQWEFIAPFFRADRSHRFLHSDTIMPFIGRKQLADGGFGVVFRETMAENHHGLDCGRGVDGKVRIVRKELLPDDTTVEENLESENRFRAEERLLLMLRELRHPNIVRFLASYTVRKRYELVEDEQLEERPSDSYNVHNLLFQLADIPLSRLLRSHEKYVLRRHFPTDDDLYQQLCRLSSALESLHNYFVEEHDLRLIGSHFDLAPRNILIEKGQLLLADFGLSRLRNEDSRSTTPFKAGQGDYIAPECEPVENDVFTKGRYGRPSDIWSFGCILAEIVTFIIHGAHGVQKFQSTRRHQVVPRWFSSQFHNRGAASDEVRRWLDKLSVDASNPQQSILILVRKMLSIDPKERPRAAHVTVDLFIIAQKSLWDTISTKFNDLVNGQSLLELRIERERLFAWGSVCGLEKKPIVSGNTEEVPIGQADIEWLGSSKERLFATSDLLRSVDHELDSLTTTNTTNSFPRPMCIQLRDLNERLWNIAELSMQRRMEILFEKRVLQMCGCASKEWEEFSTAAPQSAKRLGKLIAMKYMVSKIDAGNQEGLSKGRHRLLRNKSFARVSDRSLGAHGIGEISNEQDLYKRCLFEWIEYDIQWVDQEDDELYNRVGEIAELFNIGLPSGCQVLRCVGYFHRPETHSFGLIFAYPDEASAQLPPVTLKKAILRLSGRPMLGNIFELAYSLAYSLSIFHKVGWLHKQVSSYNVIFFNIALPPVFTRPTYTTDPQSEHTWYNPTRVSVV